jgi:hypothetical protein
VVKTTSSKAAAMTSLQAPTDKADTRNAGKIEAKMQFLSIARCGRRQAHSHSTINYDVELPHEGAIKEGQ